MKHQAKFVSEQKQQVRAAEQQSLEPAAREFASAEELLRFDAAQTPVPGAVAERLERSTADLPPPAGSWWRRLFKR
jgi:hypothetical protein